MKGYYVSNVPLDGQYTLRRIVYREGVERDHYVRSLSPDRDRAVAIATELGFLAERPAIRTEWEADAMLWIEVLTRRLAKLMRETARDEWDRATMETLQNAIDFMQSYEEAEDE